MFRVGGKVWKVGSADTGQSQYMSGIVPGLQYLHIEWYLTVAWRAWSVQVPHLHIRKSLLSHTEDPQSSICEAGRRLPHVLGPRKDRLLPFVLIVILRILCLIHCTLVFQSLAWSPFGFWGPECWCWHPRLGHLHTFDSIDFDRKHIIINLQLLGYTNNKNRLGSYTTKNKKENFNKILRWIKSMDIIIDKDGKENTWIYRK